MTTPSGGTDAETRQGVAAADAAKAAGAHLVFTSVGSANRQTGTPHFDSKYDVEKYIAKVGVRATILAPVAFMENQTIRPDAATVYALQDAAQGWKDIAGNLPGVHGMSPSGPGAARRKSHGKIVLRVA